MTEAEWLSCAHPTPMLEFLRNKASDRKLRLFGCSCCRRLMRPAPEIILASEAFADGLFHRGDLERLFEEHGARDGSSSEWAANRAVVGALLNPDMRGVVAEIIDFTTYHTRSLVREQHGPIPDVSSDPRLRSRSLARAMDIAGEIEEIADGAALQERKAQANLVRDIFGNPLRPIAFDPLWINRNVVMLAHSIYTERDFVQMPILADGLEEAGCDNADILNHCRSAGPHVRGCWVVDLLLGKS